MTEIGPGYPSETLDTKEYTFVGVLRTYFDELSEYKRNENTKEEYISLWYNKRLIPALPWNKALADYTNDDYEKAICLIEKENYDYSDSTLDKLRFLFWDVYEIGFRKGLYEDQLNWKKLGILNKRKLNESERREQRKNVQMKKKSFTVEEEKRILDWIVSTDIADISGKEVGLILMFFLGLRNNEACGLNFSDVRELTSYRGTKVVCIYKTVKLRSNELKLGGKTVNAARIIPLLAPLEEFLQRRFCYVLERCKDKYQKEEIQDFPIASDDVDFSLRLTSEALTTAGYSFFDRLHLSDEDRYQGLYKTASQAFYNHSGIEEQNLTTYLFRRNFATHLYCLGLDAGEIQYLIGHDVENSNDMRNFYSNEDRLKELCEKFKRHPYMIYSKAGFKEKTIIQALTDDDNTLNIKIAATEPKDDIKLVFSTLPSDSFVKKTDDIYNCIRITSSADISGRYTQFIDITEKMRESFKEPEGG